ncbi:MAG: hypothetical protein HZY73_09230 [Micropruina sp.]|nr:MAG: hypothetical protein HZY73_09230 [Micropruina sp.]
MATSCSIDLDTSSTCARGVEHVLAFLGHLAAEVGDLPLGFGPQPLGVQARRLAHGRGGAFGLGHQHVAMLFGGPPDRRRVLVGAG